jgi:hypothetical protein
VLPKRPKTAVDLIPDKPTSIWSVHRVEPRRHWLRWPFKKQPLWPARLVVLGFARHNGSVIQFPLYIEIFPAPNNYLHFSRTPSPPFREGRREDVVLMEDEKVRFLALFPLANEILHLQREAAKIYNGEVLVPTQTQPSNDAA